MTRAAILIGVNKTGGLPELFDAAKGARAMEQWALEQGMARKNVYCFTDEQGPVEAHAIRAAVKALVDAGNIEQLFIYFAGHGVNIRYGEFWLLSGAPEDSSAAINVDGCVYRARASGIPHVVFISDACRTAALGIQGQGIDGSVVFPNDPVPGPEQYVDMFFATTLGRPALEIKDPHSGQEQYKALYTEAFLKAVSGKLPGCLDADGAHRVVRPRRLKRCLANALPQRILDMNAGATVTQIPDARVTSDDDAWLARFPMADIPAAVPDSMVPISGSRGIKLPGGFDERRAGAAAGAILSPQEQATQIIADLLASNVPPAARPQPGTPGHYKSGPAPSGDAAPHVPASPGTRIKVVNGKIRRCFVPATRTSLTADQAAAGIAFDGPATDVLLTFGDRSAALLPCIPGFATTVIFDEGELADVAFEPLAASVLSQGAARADAARRLHGAVAAAARTGVFHCERATGRLLAEHFEQPGTIDPALALYAAYGFHDEHMQDALGRLDQALTDQLSFSFFDLALLTRRLAAVADAPSGYRPCLPLLARGWSIWSAAQAPLPDIMIALRRELLPSLWTHFTAAGADRLHAYFNQER